MLNFVVANCQAYSLFISILCLFSLFCPLPLLPLLLFSYVYVQMSSAAGKTPAPGQAVYSASKHALNGYFHTLRSEVKIITLSV